MVSFFKRIWGVVFCRDVDIVDVNLDKCTMRIFDGQIEVFVPHLITLTNRTDNTKENREGWLIISDVGHQWSSFELIDPLDTRYRLYIGEGHSYETAMTFSHLHKKLQHDIESDKIRRIHGRRDTDMIK